MTDPRDMLWQAIQLITQARKDMATYRPLTDERIREIFAEELAKAMIRAPEVDEPDRGPPPTLEGDGYLRAEELAGLIAVKPVTIWRWSADGHMPKPVKLSSGVTAWEKPVIRVWLHERTKPRKGRASPSKSG